MPIVITPYSITCTATAIIAAFIAWIAWQRREIPGGKPLALLMIAVAEWSLGAAIELSVVGIPAKVFWSKVEYLGTVSAPVFFLLLALEYNRLDHWLTRRNILFLFIIPLTSLFLAITNEWHGWIWSGFDISPFGHNLLIYEHGWWFWLGLVGYSYLVILIGTVLFIWAAIRFPRVYRNQAGIMLLGAAVPWIGNLIYILGLSPAPGLELTPIALAFSGVFMALGIFRFHLIDLVPVARDTLIETMQAGVLVLDEQNRVVDINPAAQRLLDTSIEASLGKSAGDVFSVWPELVNCFRETQETHVEIALREPRFRFLELNITPIFNRQTRFTGRLITLVDITARKRIEGDLQHANEQLRAQLVEIESLHADLREQAVRDMLTGLFNRRYLTETLERELAQAERTKSPLSVVMMDIDHFKDFNDTYGHKAGDDLLQNLGEFLRANTRIGDVACRYGGEEFVVIMPGAPIMVAFKRAEQWVQAFRDTGISDGNQTMRATLSAGVSVFPENGTTADEVLRTADLALYTAKAAGRNRVAPVTQT